MIDLACIDMSRMVLLVLVMLGNHNFLGSFCSLAVRGRLDYDIDMFHIDLL
jgi:hypothetical protein